MAVGFIFSPGGQLGTEPNTGSTESENPDPNRDPCGEPQLVPFEVRDLGTGEVGKWPYVNSRVASNFYKALEEINDQLDNLGFTEMFRPTNYQEKLYANYLANLKQYNSRSWSGRQLRTPPLPADPPGTSAHEAGVAFDIPLYGENGRYSKEEITVLTSGFVKNGFVQGVSGDPVHFVWKEWLTMSAEEKKKMVEKAQAYYNCKFKQ
jgi:hypothetical protein